MDGLRREAERDGGHVAVVPQGVGVRGGPHRALGGPERVVDAVDDEHERALRDVHHVDPRVRDLVVEPRSRGERRAHELEVRSRNRERRELDAAPARAPDVVGRPDHDRGGPPERVAEERGDVVAEDGRDLREAPDRDVGLPALDGAEERLRKPRLLREVAQRETASAP